MNDFNTAVLCFMFSDSKIFFTKGSSNFFLPFSGFINDALNSTSSLPFKSFCFDSMIPKRFKILVSSENIGLFSGSFPPFTPLPSVGIFLRFRVMLVKLRRLLSLDDFVVFTANAIITNYSWNPHLCKT